MLEIVRIRSIQILKNEFVMHVMLRFIRKNRFDLNLISNMHDCIPFANPNKSKLSHGKVDKVQSYWHPVP